MIFFFNRENLRMERLLLVFDLAINFVKGRLVTMDHGSARAALHL